LVEGAVVVHIDHTPDFVVGEVGVALTACLLVLLVTLTDGIGHQGAGVPAQADDLAGSDLNGQGPEVVADPFEVLDLGDLAFADDEDALSRRAATGGSVKALGATPVAHVVVRPFRGRLRGCCRS
jgi:hypothetical protein